MIDDDKGWTMLAGDADTENDHLRLALATMAARERETAAERDALRSATPCGRCSRLRGSDPAPTAADSRTSPL